MITLAIVVGMAVFGALLGFIQPSVIEHGLVNAMVAVVLAIAAAQLELGLGTGGYVAVAVGFFAAMSTAGMTAAHHRNKRRR